MRSNFLGSEKCREFLVSTRFLFSLPVISLRPFFLFISRARYFSLLFLLQLKSQRASIVLKRESVSKVPPSPALLPTCARPPSRPRAVPGDPCPAQAAIANDNGSTADQLTEARPGQRRGGKKRRAGARPGRFFISPSPPPLRLTIIR